MFIHRGESFGSTGSVEYAAPRKNRVPDLILGDDECGYSPLPCIQVTQAADGDLDACNEGGLSCDPSLRRASIGVMEPGATSPKGLKARPQGRTSRRVSLIPSEALAQAHEVLEREALQSRRGSSSSNCSLFPRQDSKVNSTGHLTATLEQVLRASLQQTQQMEQQRRASYASYRESCDDYGQSKDDSEGGGGDRRESQLDGETMSPLRMKSNQRWLKLRTTVQLSGALSSSMNRAKPTLKREDSFIKRFSTRQIPELQDTVDHTDEEDLSKTSTGSPKIRRKRRVRHPFTVINPYGSVFFYWLFILTACVLYNLWTAIVREAFPELQERAQTLWYVLDGFTDLTYIVDIIVQVRTGYLEQGLIVYDTNKLAKHYLHSKSFLLDLLTIFPLDLIQFAVGMHPMLRFPRFIKVYRVYFYYYMVESRTLYPNFWRVLNLVHILLLLAHWFGCFYYMLSESEKFKGEWTYPYNYGEEFRTLSRKYLGSVYWSTLTLTTIGDLPTPESDKQYIFTIISYLIGVFIFATIVGQVGNVITNRNANRLEFERLLDGAKLYMRHHRVPREMQRRVQRWYDYSWSRGRIQGGGDINTALGLLPDKLKTELALHVNLSTLKKVSIFKECQPEFLHDLVLKMKAYIFTPGDLICRKGEVAREMFIIADGILEVISELGKVLTTMKAGDFFGEIGILNLDGLNKRTADVRSVGYSELFSLSREDVLAAMKDYPEAQEILQSLGHKRLKEARHTGASKTGSASSSKRGSLSPTRELGEEERPTKKIVSRLRSDVSAIRNAFRKGRAITRDLETMELEPLTPEESSNELGGTSVRRILKLPRQMTLAAKRAAFRSLGRSTASGSSGSSGGTRGAVLKRMSHVSDESQKNQTDDKNVLGAGLPLLQRLKLLKEKEERENEKNKLEEEDRVDLKSSRELSPTSKDTFDEEPEVIGAGLPLFARLKLLKAKEDKERAEAKEKYVNERGNLIETSICIESDDSEVPCIEQENNSDSKSLKILQRKSSGRESSPSNTASLFKIRLKSVLHQGKDPTAKRPSIDENINDLNKGTEHSSQESDPDVKSNNNTLLHNNTKEVKANNEGIFGKAFKRMSKKLNVPSAVPPATNIQPNQEKESPKVSDTLTIADPTNKDKIQRSESFKKAMDEGLIEGSGESEFNIQVSESDSSMDDNKLTIKPTSEPNKDEPLHDEKVAKSEDLHPGLEVPHPIEALPETPNKKIDSSPDDNTKSPSTLKRKTLSSPPLHSILSPTSRVHSPHPQQRSSSPTIHFADDLISPEVQEKQLTTDGVQKVLTKLASIGIDTGQASHAEDLFRGVRKILRDKIEDVELAWEARIEALQQEIVLRDATIHHLTDTIVHLQGKTGSNGSTDEISIRMEGGARLENHSEDPKRGGRTTGLKVQLSETSNPSSDEDEPLFMRCNSIDSIIHQSPEFSPESEKLPSLPIPRTRPQMQRQISIAHNRFVERENDELAYERKLSQERRLSEERKRSFEKKREVVIDVGESSTDDDVYSFSSDDDHVFGSISESVKEEEINETDEQEFEEEEEEEEEEFQRTKTIQRGEQELNSQDWEVQMLASQLAQEQRGFARMIDRDIASGKLHSPLAELHEALATDNIHNLTELDLLRLEKIVRREREKLRQYARMYSLDERPVLEDEFTSLYRSRSQLLLSKSSELCQAGPTQRRLSSLLKQLTTLPPSEQFLLDRLVYKKSKQGRRFNRQHSLCDERLSFYEEVHSTRSSVKSAAALRRSLSMCSPPPTDHSSLIRRTSDEDGEDVFNGMPIDSHRNRSDVLETSQKVSNILASLQRSTESISSGTHHHQPSPARGGSHHPQNKEIQQNLRPPR